MLCADYKNCQAEEPARVCELAGYPLDGPSGALKDINHCFNNTLPESVTVIALLDICYVIANCKADKQSVKTPRATASSEVTRLQVDAPAGCAFLHCYCGQQDAADNGIFTKHLLQVTKLESCHRQYPPRQPQHAQCRMSYQLQSLCRDCPVLWVVC